MQGLSRNTIVNMLRKIGHVRKGRNIRKVFITDYIFLIRASPIPMLLRWTSTGREAVEISESAPDVIK